MDQIGTRHRLDLYNIKKELTGPPPTRMWPTLYWGPGGLMGEDEGEDILFYLSLSQVRLDHHIVLKNINL